MPRGRFVRSLFLVFLFLVGSSTERVAGQSSNRRYSPAPAGIWATLGSFFGFSSEDNGSSTRQRENAVSREERTQAALAAARRVEGRTANVVAEFFAPSARIVDVTTTCPYSFHAIGTIISGAPGSANAQLAFERDGGSPANDLFSIGTGRLTNGSSYANTFDIAEPLPPNEVPTSPGSSYMFDGGTAVQIGGAPSQAQQDEPFQTGDEWLINYSFSQTETIELPGAGGAGLRRVKLAENNSPIPRDRYFLDYRFFRDVVGGIGDVNRYSFGTERTWQNGLASIEARVPIAATLDSDQVLGTTGAKNIELGNVAVVFKQVYYRWQSPWSGNVDLHALGLGVSLPTGDDTRLFRSDGTQVLEIDNHAVHLLPYMASLWTWGTKFYVQAFLQLDLDLNGNPVYGSATGVPLSQIGQLNDSTLLFADVSAGYFFFESPCPNCWLQQVAAIAELHYNTTLQDSDFVSANGLYVSDTSNRFDILNGTLGIHAVLGRGYTLTTGVNLPLRGGDDKQFDYEIVALVNNYF